MNILLINVSLRPESKVKYFPVGLGYIATCMRNAGFAFDLVDIDLYRYTDEEVNALIGKKDYDVACIGCLVTGYKFVKKLCGEIRRQHPNCRIIVGNSVASSICGTLLAKTEADIAVMGEGDITIVETLSALSKNMPLDGIAGLSFRRDGQIIRNPPRAAIEDISSLPFIDFSLFDVDAYIANSPNQVDDGIPIPRAETRSLPVNTARGCVARCTFCYHNFNGYKFRYRSVESVVSEIEVLIEKYKLNHIGFWDELSLFSKHRAETFADAVLERKLKFYWSGTCRADCFTSDADLPILEKLREAGCTNLGYSLESSNPAILKAMNKNITVDQFAKTTELIHRAGITPLTSLVIGYPQETVDTICDTFKVCADNRIYPSAGFLLPQPGSGMYEYAIANGFITDEEDYLLRMGDRQDLRINMTAMSDSEMENAVLRGLRMCNETLHMNFREENLIKTQYYRSPKK